MRARATRGLTLIEILVVVAIIAVLAGILFPVFGRVRDRANRTTCISNHKQLAAAIHMYTSENKERLPGEPGVADAALWRRTLATDEGLPDAVFDCRSTRQKGTIGDPDYGMNFALYGKYLGEIDPEGEKSARIVVTVETRPSLGLAQTLDDVDLDRHNKTPVAGYLDGHADKFGGTLGW